MKKGENKINTFPLFVKIIISSILTLLFIVVTYISITRIAPVSLILAIVLIVCANIITSIGYIVVFA